MARCDVHAYVLMTNHVHLLVTPQELHGPARMMQSLGRCYVRFFNDRHHRTGTLWEGRFRSKLVNSTDLPVQVQPVHRTESRARRTRRDPLAYEWSSYRSNAYGADDPITSPHLGITTLGDGRAASCEAYREMFSTELAPSEIAAMRIAPLHRPKLPCSAYLQAADSMMTTEAPDAASVHGAEERGQSQL